MSTLWLDIQLSEENLVLLTVGIHSMTKGAGTKALPD